jgi:hypothetical protein
MQEWWTYRLSDFLLFSPRTYYRMFELYHEQIWPVHLVVPASIAVLLRSNAEWRDRAIAALLATCWFWVGIAFHLQRYAPINWAAKYFAGLFVAQALLLVWYGVARQRLSFRLTRDRGTHIGLGLFAVAIIIVPAAGVLAGRSWRQIELPGLTPDPTAVVTLALLVLSAPRAPGGLLIIPLLWCAIGSATLWGLGSGEAWVLLLAGLWAFMLAVKPSRSTSP